MKQKITREIWLCDVCGRQDGFIGTCRLCGKEHCSMCSYIGYNPTSIDICRNHQNDDSMKEAMQSFESKFSKLKEEMLNKIRKVAICTNLEVKNEKTNKNKDD
jgi:hypothetical protein